MPSLISQHCNIGTCGWSRNAEPWAQAVDELLWKWDSAYGSLYAAEAKYEASGCKKRPTHHLKKWRCRGALATHAVQPASCFLAHHCLLCWSHHIRGLWQGHSQLW